MIRIYKYGEITKEEIFARAESTINVEEIVSDIESELLNSLNQEVSSCELGEMVMRRLKAIDKVAYVRFASVYREFQDIDTFFAELKELKEEKNDSWNSM